MFCTFWTCGSIAIRSLEWLESKERMIKPGRGRQRLSASLCKASHKWPGMAAGKVGAGFALFGFLFSGGSDLRGRTACAGAVSAAAAANNDLARPRTGHGPTDTAVARHTAVNLPR